eukprot:gene5572-6261_t
MLKHSVQVKRSSITASGGDKNEGSYASSRPSCSRGYVNKAFVQTEYDNTSNNESKQGPSCLDNTNGSIKLSPTLQSQTRTSSPTTTTVNTNTRASVRRLERIQEELNDDIKDIEEYNSKRKCLTFASLLFTAVACISFGIGHYFIGYFPESVMLNEADTKMLTYSTYFCSAVYTETPDVWMTVLGTTVLKKTPLIYYRNTQLNIGVGETWKRNFYLTSRTILNITIQSMDIVDMLVFMGEKNMNIWTERKRSETHLIKETCCLNIPGKQCETYQLKVEQESNYYLVIHRSSPHATAASLNLTLKFTRPEFDFAKTVGQCKTTEMAGKPCQVALKYASDDRTVIERPMKYKGLAIEKASNVEWKCVARVWFYVIAYASIYLLVCIVVLMVYKVADPMYVSRCTAVYSKKKPKAMYQVEYRRSSETRQTEGINVVVPDRKLSICKSRHSDSVSYESITKYHNQTLESDDDYDDYSSMKQGTNGDLDTNRNGSANKQPPTGIATIYRDVPKRGERGGSLITKYIAPKKQSTPEKHKDDGDGEKEHASTNEEVVLSWPHDSVPTSSDLPFAAYLRPTRSTGYFRVYSPKIHTRTGAVAGRRELRTPNPIFYRPGSELSTTTTTGEETISIQDAIDV